MLSAGVLAGVVIGVALSLLWLVYVATTPRIPLLTRQPGTQVFRDADEHPGDETFDGIIILRLDFGLSFATAEALEERVRALLDAEDRAPRRRPRLRRRGLHRLPGLREAGRDPPAHRRVRRHAARSRA